MIVHLSRARMPSPPAWQNAIRAAGFSVEIDTDFDVDEFSGFLPCTVEGREAGFEYYASPWAPLDATFDEEPEEVPPGTDFFVTLATSSSPREFAASIAASSVLCRMSGGQLTDPQAGKSWSGDAALDWAKTEFAALLRDLKK